ncbi:hypothetical protein [Metabacillus fastidiosus]|uniref:Uncharacterized protein n=1 Tax=Metabacillus fastidiosus TaxID=1458 RepID=A0ABU6NW27_9BACI|nr:hypothetical protein [Metabacillus fastidiosus]
MNLWFFRSSMKIATSSFVKWCIRGRDFFNMSIPKSWSNVKKQ